jgi:hypothetical protein
MVDIRRRLWEGPIPVSRLRSRGEVLFDDNPADTIPGRILGEATMVQTFMVRGLHPRCLAPRAVRLHLDFDPVDLFNGEVPVNPH